MLSYEYFKEGFSAHIEEVGSFARALVLVTFGFCLNLYVVVAILVYPDRMKHLAIL